MLRSALGLIVTAMLGSFAHAQYEFDFVNTKGFRLATLELASVPATHDDFVSLEFHIDAFNFGTLYTGTFDAMSSTSAEFRSTESGGLTGFDASGNPVALMRDFDPPPFVPGNGNLPQGATVVSFDLYASSCDIGDNCNGLTFVNLDRMQVTYQREDGTMSEFGSAGYWQPVPEPSGLQIVVLASVGLAPFRRRRSS